MAFALGCTLALASRALSISLTTSLDRCANLQSSLLHLPLVKLKQRNVAHLASACRHHHRHGGVSELAREKGFTNLAFSAAGKSMCSNLHLPSALLHFPWLKK